LHYWKIYDQIGVKQGGPLSAIFSIKENGTERKHLHQITGRPKIRWEDDFKKIYRG